MKRRRARKLSAVPPSLPPISAPPISHDQEVRRRATTLLGLEAAEVAMVQVALVAALGPPVVPTPLHKT